VLKAVAVQICYTILQKWNTNHGKKPRFKLFGWDCGAHATMC